MQTADTSSPHGSTHIGIDPHADEIALFAVVPTGLAHGFDPSIGLRFERFL
jgi:hypothetical protein